MYGERKKYHKNNVGFHFAGRARDFRGTGGDDLQRFQPQRLVLEPECSFLGEGCHDGGNDHLQPASHHDGGSTSITGGWGKVRAR